MPAGRGPPGTARKATRRRDGFFRKLRSELERGIFRAWEGLTEGWREVLSRSGGALTHFVRSEKEEQGDAAQEDFPR